jgi:hypothetical protein
VREQTDIPVRVLLDATSVRSRTRATTVGPYVLVLDTVLPDKAIQLHSIYTGHPKVRTLASHLLLAPDLHQTLSAEHEHDAIPVTHARRRCLYDHLQCLQDLLQRGGAEANIPIDDEATRAVER